MVNDENAYFNANCAATQALCFGGTSPSSSELGGANKGALSFILSSSSSDSDSEFQAPVAPTGLIKRKRVRGTVPAADATRGATRSSPSAAAPAHAAAGFTSSISAAVAASAGSALVKKGSKFCIVDGCMSRAKHAKRCWRHGGSVKCKVADCDNRAKSKGVCWSHGGGTLCSFDRCDTISVSNGFCWAHGGGKRCTVPQCSKPAYERTQNYCTAHFEERVGSSSAATTSQRSA